MGACASKRANLPNEAAGDAQRAVQQRDAPNTAQDESQPSLSVVSRSSNAKTPSTRPSSAQPTPSKRESDATSANDVATDAHASAESLDTSKSAPPPPLDAQPIVAEEAAALKRLIARLEAICFSAQIGEIMEFASVDPETVTPEQLEHISSSISRLEAVAEQRERNLANRGRKKSLLEEVGDALGNFWSGLTGASNEEEEKV